MCCSFQDVMTSKTLASTRVLRSIRRLKIVELLAIVGTCIFEAVGSKAK